MNDTPISIPNVIAPSVAFDPFLASTYTPTADPFLDSNSFIPATPTPIATTAALPVSSTDPFLHDDFSGFQSAPASTVNGNVNRLPATVAAVSSTGSDDHWSEFVVAPVNAPSSAPVTHVQSTAATSSLNNDPFGTALLVPTTIAPTVGLHPVYSSESFTTASPASFSRVASQDSISAVLDVLNRSSSPAHPPMSGKTSSLAISSLMVETPLPPRPMPLGMQPGYPMQPPPGPMGYPQPPLYPTGMPPPYPQQQQAWPYGAPVGPTYNAPNMNQGYLPAMSMPNQAYPAAVSAADALSDPFSGLAIGNQGQLPPQAAAYNSNIQYMNSNNGYRNM